MARMTRIQNIHYRRINIYKLQLQRCYFSSPVDRNLIRYYKLNTDNLRK